MKPCCTISRQRRLLKAPMEFKDFKEGMPDYFRHYLLKWFRLQRGFLLQIVSEWCSHKPVAEGIGNILSGPYSEQFDFWCYSTGATWGFQSFSGGPRTAVSHWTTTIRPCLHSGHKSGSNPRCSRQSCFQSFFTLFSVTWTPRAICNCFSWGLLLADSNP